jgi:hypothetical protein
VDGLGDGSTSPDGTGVGTEQAQVRAERAESGNGRVYHIAFTASDGNGAPARARCLSRFRTLNDARPWTMDRCSIRLFPN